MMLLCFDDGLCSSTEDGCHAAPRDTFLSAVSLCILCTTSCVLVAFIVAVVGRQVSHFAQADRSAVLGAGAYVR